MCFTLLLENAWAHFEESPSNKNYNVLEGKGTREATDSTFVPDLAVWGPVCVGPTCLGPTRPSLCRMYPTVCVGNAITSILGDNRQSVQDIKL